MSDHQHPDTENRSLARQEAGRDVASPIRQPVALVLTGIGGLALAYTLLVSFNALIVVFGLAALSIGLARGWMQRSARQGKTLEVKAQDPMRLLKRKLSQCQYLEHLDARGPEKALGQLEASQDRLEKFEPLLLQKFERGELTFQRYFGAAQQVQQAVLANLQELVTRFEHLDSLDLPGLQAERSKLQRRQDSGESEALASLEERLKLAQELEQDIQDRLSYNEKALTGLDHVFLAISNITTSKSGAQPELETVMDELKELAERAEKYST